MLEEWVLFVTFQLMSYEMYSLDIQTVDRTSIQKQQGIHLEISVQYCMMQLRNLNRTRCGLSYWRFQSISTELHNTY